MTVKESEKFRKRLSSEKGREKKDLSSNSAGFIFLTVNGW